MIEKLGTVKKTIKDEKQRRSQLKFKGFVQSL